MRAVGGPLGSLAIADWIDTGEEKSPGLGQPAPLGQPAFCETPGRSAPTAALPKMSGHSAKATRVIMLVMEGGPSHLDTFDPKPELVRRHGTRSTVSVGSKTKSDSETRMLFASPFQFRHAGDHGIEMCDRWQHLADPFVANELCNYRGCQTGSLRHHEALFELNTGSRCGSQPALGARINHAMCSEDSDAPGFIVMTPSVLPQGGPTNWSSGDLPSEFRGTRLQSPASTRVTADAIDLRCETRSTHKSYGLDDPRTETFGRQCLTARRLVENGVRFVQVFSGGWDSHDYLGRGHSARIKSVDRPIAALIGDLKRRGMLQDTLVVWTGEFGRTPDCRFGSDRRSGTQPLGRDHNCRAMTMLFAGGGIKPGVVGATDALGATAVECVRPIGDVHQTILRLLGLDDDGSARLGDGPQHRLPQSVGRVIEELIA